MNSVLLITNWTIFQGIFEAKVSGLLYFRVLCRLGKIISFYICQLGIHPFGSTWVGPKIQDVFGKFNRANVYQNYIPIFSFYAQQRQISYVIVNCSLQPFNGRARFLRYGMKVVKRFPLRIYQNAFILIPIYQVLPRHVETIIRHGASSNNVHRFTFCLL